ncbi:MAG TPA: lysophospholipid acyltransferase family protein [Gaiellaceae bacterium]|nr:lysophospholipid acyltransferase family protein [Gaiellaceae bacterium]
MARPSPLYRFIAACSRPLLRVLFRYEASGIEHLPEGGFVLAAGHHSNFDPWPLAIAISRRYFVRFMAKSELFWPPLSWIVRGAGGFEVRRGAADREALATARRLAREGNVVAMFPEGTRRSKGLRKRRQVDVRTGAARIALGAGVPLVPAALSGTDRLARLARLRVAYGPPVALDDLAGLPRREAARIATERLMERIHELEASLDGSGDRQARG